MLTIVMYHYVRDLQPSRFPRIKGLDLRSFRGQLEYLSRRHSVVTMEEVMYAVQGSPADLPDDAALLTFDDGLVDHFTNVLPLLDERGWQGSFFPPARPVMEHKVLDVHKLHFVLASVEDPQVLVDELIELLDPYRGSYDLAAAEDYWARLGKPSRFDPPTIGFLKRMLQRELPSPIREDLCEHFFRKYVTFDETSFAGELYLSIDQLRMMQRLGMHIGVHGETHGWLDAAGPQDREREIRSSLELLSRVGADTESWSIAYPYGAHDEALRSLVRSAGAKVGVTTEVARADLWRHDPLMLPRLDTNDIPKQHSNARIPVMVGAATV
jgi:peptidoglycan/xylan/chitin deacetylase (PgdA/CDA1 family)